MKSIFKMIGLSLSVFLVFSFTFTLPAYALELPSGPPPNPLSGILPGSSDMPDPGTRDEVQLTPPLGQDFLPHVPSPGDVKISYVFSNLIPFLIRFGISLAGILAVLSLIYGGYLYLTAYGDTEKHKKALNTIIYALIGLVITITAYGIVQILIRINLT